MSDCVEVAVTSDSSDQLWSCCVWDVRTGTHLISYKGGGAPGAHTLATIANQFILTGNMVKPMLHIWPINRHEAIATRFILPGRPTAVAVSPDGTYCIVAVQETINVYQLATGAMLATISRHYQAVNVLRFTDDGAHFISAGQDGMVLVWNLSHVIRVYQKQSLNALYSFSDHALPVTDLFIGKGGMKALFCSVSADRSCKEQQGVGISPSNSFQFGALLVPSSPYFSYSIKNCIDDDLTFFFHYLTFPTFTYQ